MAPDVITSLTDWPLFRASFIKARGVAPVCASRYGVFKPEATGHVVICTGKEINKNTRPTKAGLKMLQPNPPKLILPIPIATNAPMIIIHTGRLEGTLKAKSTPVMRAEPSKIVGCCFNKSF